MINFFNFLKEKEKTIGKEITITGIGLHSGNNSTLKLKPSERGGIVFRNNNGTEVKALYNNVVDTNLGTTIGLPVNDGVEKFLTIEHLMAGIWASDIDNLIVEIDNQEVPILDGSAQIFLREIEMAGIKKLETNRQYLKILKEVKVEDGDKYIKIAPASGFSIDITVEFPYGNIGKQQAFFNGKRKEFAKEMVKARTFCNEKEVEYMRSIGLARGGSLENAMVFNENGLMNREGFRMENEVAKHKLLDCIGDMFTSGYNILGKITSYKGGHSMNNALLKAVFSDKDNYKIV